VCPLAVNNSVVKAQLRQASLTFQKKKKQLKGILATDYLGLSKLDI
jgi:hypothetical protein